MKRKDARKLKTVDPFMRVVAHVMSERNDSMIMFEDSFNCEHLDAFIKEQKEKGIKFTYLDIVAAAVVRMLATHPQLNRYIMNGRIYARNEITISYAIQKDIKAGSSETTVKVHFDGTENIFEVRDKIHKTVDEVLAEKTDASTETDKVADILAKLPDWLFKLAVNVLKFMDRHNMCPQAVIDASPFHTSFFITNMKSLGINYIYHHIYNFGTTGIFIGLGKEKDEFVPDLENKPVLKKMLPLGFVLDERIAEGMQFALGLKFLKRVMRNPMILAEKLDEVTKDID